jgi:hypothetical protein
MVTHMLTSILTGPGSLRVSIITKNTLFVITITQNERDHSGAAKMVLTDRMAAFLEVVLTN